MTRTITAALHDPEGETVRREIPDELPAFREFIGGCVEGYHVSIAGRRLVAYCHEEGRILGMPPSVVWPDGEVYMVGRIIFTVPDGEGGDDSVPLDAYLRMVERGREAVWEGRRLNVLVLDGRAGQ